METPQRLGYIGIRLRLRGHRQPTYFCQKRSECVLYAFHTIKSWGTKVISIRLNKRNRAYQYRKFLLVFVCIILCSNYNVTAQTDKTIRKHVIIALDQYPGSISDKGPDAIRKALTDASIMVPQIINVLDSLLSDSDYVSIVNYSIGTKDRSWDNFTTNTWSWEKYELFRLSLPGMWGKISANHKNEGEPFSLLQGGKYYSFHSLFNKNKTKYSNNIFLLDVSDEYFNGGDNYRKEFQNFCDQSEKRFEYDDFKNTLIKINQHYHFEYQKEIKINNHEGKVVTGNYGYEYKFLLYEVTPNQTTLNSVLDYPAYLGIHRVRGGYRIEFDYDNVTVDSQNPHSGYQLHRLEISPMKNGVPIKTVAFTEDAGHVSIDIDGSDVSGDTLRVEMRGWLEPKDEIYSGLIMNPYDEDFKNLNLNLSLPLDTDPKIFDIIPLYDFMWWWYPDDIRQAVYIWDIVLAFFLILAMIFIQRTLSMNMGLYIPTNSVISMNVKSSRSENSILVSETGSTKRPKSKKVPKNIIKK